MKKTWVAFLMAVTIFAFMFAVALINPLQVVQWKITDLFFRPKGVSDAITIIAIDDKSLDPAVGLGRFKDWPRSYYAQLLRTLAPLKPAAIGVDLDFRQSSKGISDLRLKQILTEYEKRITAGAPPSTGSFYEFLKTFQGDKHPDDLDLQNALDSAGVPIVLFSPFTSDDVVIEGTDQVPHVTGTIPPIYKLSEKVLAGYTNILYDRDGIVRRFIPQIANLKSFALLIAESYAKRNLAAPSDSSMLIRFTAKPNSYRTISFADALAGQFNPKDVSGKIILIGGTSAILQDAHPTPTSRLAMPGIEINAQIIAQIVEGKFVSQQGKFSLAVVLFFIALAGCFMFFMVGLRYAGVIFTLGLLAIPTFAFALYQQDIVINTVYPEITWVGAMIITLWYRNKTEFKEKRAIQKAFAHYVSPVVVNELAKDPTLLRLGGKRETISVMFSDIVGFTTLAENLSPEDTVALLNDYLTAMTDVIFSYTGTLDKYQGDAIMALFGAPLKDEDHAMSACYASLNMRRALTALHEKWGAIPALPFKDELIQLDFRVGIASGPAVVGNVGSEKRFDYTAIGDIVNLGSRLESINRKYGTRVIVDKETFTQITQSHNPFVFRKLDIVRVKGKKKETEIFELVAQSEHVTQEMKTMLDDFENGRILYTQRNFMEAKQYFEAAMARVAEDSPSLIYRNRCDFYIRKPPNRDWDAIVDLEEK